jgi:anti-sigma B factor antagonist
MQKTIKGNTLILSLNGRLDAATADTAKEILMNAVKEHKGQVLLDFCAVDYISSMGLRVILHVAQFVHKESRKIAFVSTKAPVTNVFQNAGFGLLFPMFTSMEKAESEFITIV